MQQDIINQIQELTGKLNTCRDAYYNQNRSLISDHEYDELFDELVVLEKNSGFVMANSPTQTVGYTVVDGLDKTQHTIPLLSLDKTKSVDDLLSFIGTQPVMLMHKMDGLTVKLEYQYGMLLRASTRGDGSEGEIVTHNIPAFYDVPQSIPYQERLVVTGEAYIRLDDFERLRETLLDSSGNPYKNPRNLASGSVRCYDAATCAKRCVRFTAFSVLEGLDEDQTIANSKFAKLKRLQQLGFCICNSVHIPNLQEKPLGREELLYRIESLRKNAQQWGFPIDGIVVSYDDIAYSKACGSTGHHNKDGIAFKFEDDLYETILREIQWNTTRSGLISPVAVFDAVEIDGTCVSRATLHNASNIRHLKLIPGCRISVSKRNMIIPHVESNLDPFDGEIEFPIICPCCGGAAVLKEGKGGANGSVENIFCDNSNCPARHIAGFCHFVSKKAMDIEGLSEATLEKFIVAGWLKTLPDIYHLDEHRDEIVQMEGFGDKSWSRLWSAIEESRNTTFEKFVIACDIPMIGRHASRTLAKAFNSDLDTFYDAATRLYERFDFANLDDFGETLSNNITTWFKSNDNIVLFNNLRKEVTIMAVTKQEGTTTSANPFAGKTVVVTGTLVGYTRGEIEGKLYSIGAKPGSSVSSKTDYVLAGEKAGSKLTKAQTLGVTIISEDEFNNMLGA